MIDESLSSQDLLVLLSKVQAFAASPEMAKLEALLQNRKATIEQISALLPIDLLQAALQLTVPPERFDLSNSWPPEAKTAYLKAAAAHSSRFASLRNHPAVRVFIASTTRKAKQAELEQRAIFKAQQSVFRPIFSVWEYEFWLERDTKLSPVCRVSFHSPDYELLLESTCDLQDLTFLARRFLQLTQNGLERSLPWAAVGVLDIPFQEEIVVNIAEMEEALVAIKEHAATLGILSNSETGAPPGNKS